MEYHYFTAASLYRSSLLDFAASSSLQVSHYIHAFAKDGFIFNQILVKSIYFRFDETQETDPCRSTVKISPAKRHQRLKHLSNRLSPAAVPKIFRKIARKRGNAEPRRIRSSAEESSPVDLAYNISCRLLFLLCRPIDRAGASTRAPRRVRRLGYTRVTGKANARERAKKAWERWAERGRWFVARRVSLSVGLTARPPGGIRRICSAARANTSRMKEVWLPFRARRAAAKRGKYWYRSNI